MRKSLELIIIIACFILIVIGCSRKQDSKEIVNSKPNVIIILTDDQGYGDFECHGNPWLKTPNMDRLYESGVSLSDFHVDPTCAPTRAALMTGRYSSRVGVWKTFKGRHHLREDEVTMADIFAANGYETAIFGKWHLGDNYPFRPKDRGFKESMVHGGGVIGEAPDYWGNLYYNDKFLRNGVLEQTDGYCTDVWFKEAKKFVSSNKKKPFFLYLPLNAPHGPMHVPKRYVQPYLNNKEIPEERAWFYGMLANIDENLGSFKTFLDEQGVSDNTILIFMNDNGTSHGVSFADGRTSLKLGSGYNAGMRGKKTSPFDGGHRAACIINWPAAGYKKGIQINRLTAHVDLLPTLMEMTGLSYSKEIDFDGQSFAPVLKEPDAEFPARTLFVHHQIQFGVRNADDRPIKYKDYAVMTEDWRFVNNELFDYKNDPGQTKDVSDTHPKIVNEMKVAYEKWWDDIDDKFNDYCRTVIGSEFQAETQLDCQSWHGELALYNQQQIRNGIQCNGFWDLKSVSAGTYEIVLRRWPKELDIAIEETVDAPILDPEKSYMGDRMVAMSSGAIIPVSARLKVGDFDKTVKVAKGQKEVEFEVELPAGALDLQTWFTDAEGKEWGAYYVYVKKNQFVK